MSEQQVVNELRALRRRVEAISNAVIFLAACAALGLVLFVVAASIAGPAS